MLLTIVKSATDNCERCYWQLWKVLLTIVKGVTDNCEKCYWQLWKVLLTIVKGVTDNCEKCFWQLWKVLLTIVKGVIDNCERCYWQLTSKQSIQFFHKLLIIKYASNIQYVVSCLWFLFNAKFKPSVPSLREVSNC